MVEAVVALVVTPLSPHWIGGFEKPFLLDMEEDLGLGRVEWGIGEPGDGMLDSLCIDVKHLAASPEGARSNFGGNRGRSLVGWVTKGYPSGGSIAPAWVREAAWGSPDLRSTVETLRLSGGGGGPGSLNRRQYHPGVREGGFPSPNKGSEGGGCGAPPEVGCVVGGTSSPRLLSAERSCDIKASF
ncbi:hypothetical protein BHE74_00017321 [Ensete ventricosum]|nr:hypothetical protein BHE74_00017321 [Ensete ventricosum]